MTKKPVQTYFPPEPKEVNSNHVKIDEEIKLMWIGAHNVLGTPEEVKWKLFDQLLAFLEPMGIAAKREFKATCKWDMNNLRRKYNSSTMDVGD